MVSYAGLEGELAAPSHHDGDLLITENDNGYIRKINFLRLTP